MKTKSALPLILCCPLLAIAAQAPAIIPLASEPHHHLALHNEYVNLYEVEVAPHDSVQLHRHDFDAISVMIGDAQVAVQAPGKADVHLKLFGGQVRLQPRGYVHSTSIEGDTVYRNVTVELLVPQQGAQNLCAAVLATEPLNCPSAQARTSSATHVDQPQFETEQTYVTLIRVLPHQKVTLDNGGRAELIVALEASTVGTADGTSPEKSLHAGDFVWRDAGRAAQVFKNSGDKEARLVSFVFKSQGAAGTVSTSAK